MLSWKESGGPRREIEEVAKALGLRHHVILRRVESSLPFPFVYVIKFLRTLVLIFSLSFHYDVLYLDMMGYSFIFDLAAKILSKYLIIIFIGNYPEEMRIGFAQDRPATVRVKLAQRIFHLEELFAYRLADVLISPTPVLTEYLQLRCPGYKIAKYHDFAIVDTNEFAPDTEAKLSVKRSLGIPDDDLVLLHVGILSRYGNAMVSLRLFERLVKERNLWLVFIGSGVEESSLKEVVRIRKIKNVLFLGRQPHEKMHYYMRIGDIGLYPRAPPSGGIGGIPPELISLGIPVLAFDIPPIRLAVIDGVSGYVVQNEEQMFSKLHELITNPKELQSLAKTSRDYAIAKFSYNRFNETFDKVVLSKLESRRRYHQ